MTARVAALWRHPIKSHGRESLSHVRLEEGRTMPWDRRWAVAHEDAKIVDATAWAPCQNFSRGSKVPSLTAINTVVNESTGMVTLSHPNRPNLTFNPDTEQEAFLDWVRPLMPTDRSASAQILRPALNGMTDSDFPSLSLLNIASSDAVSTVMAMKQPLSMLRWRGNIHIDGLAPWAEREWLGKQVRIGSVEFEVREEIVRCLATTANPETGERDADTLKALNETFGHQNFGVYAVVTKSGEIALDDPVEVL
ncbi:MAG: MOSC domain-containing protein [Rhodobacteraceae bacterium]|nr:MOSC domain-containing protein [Paracoccaceae bacterium]